VTDFVADQGPTRRALQRACSGRPATPDPAKNKANRGGERALGSKQDFQFSAGKVMDFSDRDEPVSPELTSYFATGLQWLKWPLSGLRRRSNVLARAVFAGRPFAMSKAEGLAELMLREGAAEGDGTAQVR
jgi:hypothetical protein